MTLRGHGGDRRAMSRPAGGGRTVAAERSPMPARQRRRSSPIGRARAREEGREALGACDVGVGLRIPMGKSNPTRTDPPAPRRSGAATEMTHHRQALGRRPSTCGHPSSCALAIHRFFGPRLNRRERRRRVGSSTDRNRSGVRRGSEARSRCPLRFMWRPLDSTSMEQRLPKP